MNNKIIKYYNDIYIKIIYNDILKEYYVYNNLKKRYNNMINEFIINGKKTIDNFSDIKYNNLANHNNTRKKIEFILIMPYYISKQIAILEKYGENLVLNYRLKFILDQYNYIFQNFMILTKSVIKNVFSKENKEIYNKIFENMLNNKELNKFNDLYILYLLKIIFTFTKDIYLLDKLMKNYNNLILKSKYYDDIIYMILLENNVKIVKILKKYDKNIYDKFMDKYYNNFKQTKDIEHIRSLITNHANIFMSEPYLEKYKIMATEKKCAYYIMIDIIDLHFLSTTHHFHTFIGYYLIDIKPIFISKIIYDIITEMESNTKSALKIKNY